MIATLVFLGSSAAVPAVGHDNVFLAVQGKHSTLLIDCAGSPVLKLHQAGIDALSLGHVIFTHRHPDHMYGFPILMLNLWLLGQSEPLQVTGEAEGLRTARALLELFRPEEWPEFVPPVYHRVVLSQETVALDLPDLLITAAATEHIIPSMALKILNKSSGRSVVYSSDTEPCDPVARLARGAEVLIHEAAGEFSGHSSASQAGEIAATARVDELYLVHYPVLKSDLNVLLDDARKRFAGPVRLARDFGAIEF